MAYLGNSVEYALHCLLWLAHPLDTAPSSRDLADLQGVPPSFLAKIFPKLQKAGIVSASDGIAGGYRLARAPGKITVLQVIDAVEGRKSLFECRQVRERCALFEDRPPAWATQGVCGIHAAMLRVEKVMRAELHKTTLETLTQGAGKAAPATFRDEVVQWFANRSASRSETRINALRKSRRSRTASAV